MGIRAAAVGLSTAAVLLTTSHGIGLAEATVADKVTKTVEASVPSEEGQDGVLHVVTCTFYSGEPLRFPSSNKLTATGGISGCAPNDPNLCRVETDIQIYNNAENQWELYYNGRVNWGPPCQGLKSSSTTYGCEPSSRGHNYRSVTYVTITEDAITNVNSKRSATRQYYCL